MNIPELTCQECKQTKPFEDMCNFVVGTGTQWKPGMKYKKFDSMCRDCFECFKRFGGYAVGTDQGQKKTSP